MPDPDATWPLEPWEGYSAQSGEARRGLLREKFARSKDHGDQDYAFGLTAAVANYELCLAVGRGDAHDPETLAAARDLHDDAGSWVPS